MTQEQWIIEQLKNNGYITRNQCLRNYISRLGARIADLKSKGWVFNTENVKVEKPNGYIGSDYKYILVKEGKK